MVLNPAVVQQLYYFCLRKQRVCFISFLHSLLTVFAERSLDWRKAGEFDSEVQVAQAPRAPSRQGGVDEDVAQGDRPLPVVVHQLRLLKEAFSPSPQQCQTFVRFFDEFGPSVIEACWYFMAEFGSA